MNEVYEPAMVVGYEGLYQITKCGKVYSLKRNTFVSLRTSEYGYVLVKLSGDDGVRKSFRVHRLVAMAYIDNPNNKPMVNHIDADRTNNHVDNLEWTDYKENYEHMVNLGNQPKTRRPLLNKDIVEQIRSRYVLRCPTNGRLALAKEFDIDPETVRRIVNGYIYN